MTQRFSSTALRFALCLSLALAACTSTENSSRPGVSFNRIVIDELPASVSGLSVYEVVQQYRSNWLLKRGSSSINAPTEISVYLDANRSRFGPPSSLRQLRAVNVESIERLSGTEAQAEYGLDNTQGAIVVHTKRGN